MPRQDRDLRSINYHIILSGWTHFPSRINQSASVNGKYLRLILDNAFMNVEYRCDCDGIDWNALKASLIADDFDNGRTPQQLQKSFQNSRGVCIAWYEGNVVGTARALSDGVCNAYLVDVWTRSDLRRRGIARAMINRLLDELPGQHVYLQADEDLVEFYCRLGFRAQPVGMSQIVGTWLVNESVQSG